MKSAPKKKSVSYSYSFILCNILLCTVVLFSTAITVSLLAVTFCCLPQANDDTLPTSDKALPTNVSLQSVEEDSIDPCQALGGCTFYLECIKLKFSCGNDSSIINYTTGRCLAIQELGNLGFGARTQKWGQANERCLQKMLRDSYPKDSLPDPQTCLAWEHTILAMMNSCYKHKDLKTLAPPGKSVQRLVDIFRLEGSYYNNAVVDNGLVQAYADGNETIQKSLQSNHTASTKTRIILCANVVKYRMEVGAIAQEPTPEEVIDAILSALHYIPRQDLHYAGIDYELFCFNHSMNGHTDNAYHILAWFTDTPPSIITNTGIIYRQIRRAIFYGAVFEPTTATSELIYWKRTLCGDGIRQVLEGCDMASNYQSCTLDCRVRDGHDCTVELLKPSRCWKEVCGDGHRTRSEDCDDGNRDSGDGCAADCTVEQTTHFCSSAYNTTSECTPRSLPTEG